MQIHRDYDLTELNSFRVPARASAYCKVGNDNELAEALAYADNNGQPLLVLGGGSNVLFAEDYAGLVVRMGFRGTAMEQQGNDTVRLTIGAGENWHSLVLNCLSNDLYGIENLALIPGTVGAAPIQNIGAYGVELAQSFVALSAMDRASGKQREMSRSDCEFGYRNSVFKNRLAGKVIITSVTLELSRVADVNTSYQALEEELIKRGQNEQPTPSQVADAVIAIRQSKLPDPQLLPNAGSFFKNPVISQASYDELCAGYDNVPGFAQPGPVQDVKVPAAWLLEKAGWKGHRRNGVGVHEHQAVVVVNYAGAGGAELIALTQAMQASIAEKFGIALEPEVRIITSAQV